MLRLTIPAQEFWDEKNEMFIKTKEQVLTLEHSLVSLSKWESKWCKPFITKGVKTTEETIDYIKCMTLTQNVNPMIYSLITDEHIEKVNKYVDAPMTATWFSDDDEPKGKGNSEQVTSELIYYWMIAFGIPSEYQKWHLNRLLTLIKVCNAKQKPRKKKSMKEIMSRNRMINEARKKKYNTTG